MPNPWTGIGNPYTRTEVLERLHDTLSKGVPIIAAGAGTGISAKFIEKGLLVHEARIQHVVDDRTLIRQGALDDFRQRGFVRAARDTGRIGEYRLQWLSGRYHQT